MILDTSFLIAYCNIRDFHHDKSIKLMSDIISGKYGRIYITDYIFSEIATVLSIRFNDLSKTIIFCELIKDIAMIKINNRIFEEAWKIFKKQKKTKLSFTDCTIIATMKSEGIQNIATFDEDFKEIEGINVIA